MLSLILFSACMSKVQIEYTKPAEINIPSSVQRIAVVNRSSNTVSSQVLSLFFEETIKLKQPRFEIIDSGAAQMAFQKMGTTMGEPLGGPSLVRYCKDLSVDAIVALEDGQIKGKWETSEYTESVTKTETVTVDGKSEEQEVTREIVRYHAAYNADATAEWTMYSCKGDSIDSKIIRISDTWNGDGSSRIEAKDDAGDGEEIKMSISAVLAMGYLTRISPYEIEVERPVYRNRQLKAGVELLDDGKLGKARTQFKEVSQSNTGKKKGKALHNLAVAEEAAGEIEEALTHAQKAARLTGKSESIRLKKKLKIRVAELNKIEEQIQSPEPETEPAKRDAEQSEIREEDPKEKK